MTALLYILALLAIVGGTYVLALYVAVRPRPARVRRHAARGADPNPAYDLDEWLRIVAARDPAAATLRQIEERLYHA